MERKTAAVLYTGGKDSTYTCQLLDERKIRVVCLITIISENPFSYMLHTSNIEIVKTCAQVMDLPLVLGSTLGLKEKELSDIEQTVSRAKNEHNFDILASGGIASRYQKDRIESIANNCGLEPISPLWGVNQSRYMKSLLDMGYSIILTSVSAAGLDASWLGRELTIESLEKLEELSSKYGFNLAFEGGEAETLVLDCPIYKSRIRIELSDIEWFGDAGRLAIKKVELKPKSPVRAYDKSRGDRSQNSMLT